MTDRTYQIGETDPKQRDTSPRCPTCGMVMCQQFDDRPVTALATLAWPNGKYICYRCEDARDKTRGGRS